MDNVASPAKGAAQKRTVLFQIGLERSTGGWVTLTPSSSSWRARHIVGLLATSARLGCTKDLKHYSLANLACCDQGCTVLEELTYQSYSGW